MNAVVSVPKRTSLIEKIAHKYSVDPEKMLTTLKATAFRGDVTTEQLMALLVVADQYDLNPWTREIYAFPDKKNGIIPVVGVDGWSRLMNSNPNFDGMDFVESEEMMTSDEHKPCPSWIECRVFRKDRSHPVCAKERFDECYRPPFKTKDGYLVPGPWQSHTSRMLRWKSMIQAARMAFGFVGIYDPDEADRIIDVSPGLGNPRDGIETADPEKVDALVSRVVDILAADVEEAEHARMIFDIHQEIYADASLYTGLIDALRARKILPKKNWDALVALGSKAFQSRVVS